MKAVPPPALLWIIAEAPPRVVDVPPGVVKANAEHAPARARLRVMLSFMV